MKTNQSTIKTKTKQILNNIATGTLEVIGYAIIFVILYAFICMMGGRLI